VQPYKTCKLFGALRVVLGIQDAIVLLHSPKGCAYNLRYLLGVRGAKVNRILTTEMDEKDVIFGGEVRLKKAIKVVDERYNPSLIAVLTSCASSIIGEDIELICKDLKGVKAKLLPIHSGGFEGDQIEGYKEAMKRIVEDLVEVKELGDGVNLLAVYRYGWDLEEVKRLVGFITTTNSVLTAKTSLNEIKNASKARLNVIMCEASGFDAARLMKKKFGIPYVHPLLPIGIKATKDFVFSISEFFDIKIPEEFVKEERRALKKIERAKDKLIGKKVCVISGASRIAPITQFLSELGMEIVLISIDKPGETTLEDLNKVINEVDANPKVIVEPEVDEVLESIRQEKPDLIVGGLYETEISRRFRIPLLDIMHGEERTMGFEGAVNLAKSIEVVLLRR